VPSDTPYLFYRRVSDHINTSSIYFDLHVDFVVDPYNNWYNKLCNKFTANKSTTNPYIHCVSKNIPDIIYCNLNSDYQILIIFGSKSIS